MLKIALTLFVISLVWAVLGFSGMAGAGTELCRILFFIFLMLTFVALVSGAMADRNRWNRY